MSNQHTTQKTVSVRGIGLHTGVQVQMTLHPARADTGIVFWRSDLGEHERARLSADRIHETQLCTGVFLHTESVMTVEHLLSSMLAVGIDNLLVEVRGPEIPIFDGSAAAYQVIWADAGIVALPVPRQLIEITDTIRVEESGKWAELIPAEQLRLSFEVDHYKHPFLSGLPHTATFNHATDDYWQCVARARTFGFMRDVVFMQEQGLALGGTLSNAMVFDHHTIMNAEGLRFADEIVRHKILDAMGDLYALGAPILGEYRAYRSGHALNNRLVRALLDQPQNWRWISPH